MSDMPKRIWAHPEQHPHYKDWDADGWCTTSKQTGGKWAEYIRRDAPELVALVEALREIDRMYYLSGTASYRAFHMGEVASKALAAYEALK